MEFCYQELCQLAAERRARLEESRRLWKFFWEMAEEEGWIREKEQILSSDDYGKDLTSVVRLMSKHKAFEDEMSGRSGHFQQAIKEGEDMIAEEHFGSEKIRERIKDIREQWANLEQLSAIRKKHLEEASLLHQFQADADDIDAWMLDILKIVSSNDVGHDEYSTQSLVKKHKDVAEEIASYRPIIDSLHEQAKALPQEHAGSPDVQGRLSGIEERYKEVAELTRLRKQALQDTLALYKMFSEADACELWIDEKEKWLNNMQIPEKLEDLEVIQHRWECLCQEVWGHRVEVFSTSCLSQLACGSDSLTPVWSFLVCFSLTLQIWKLRTRNEQPGVPCCSCEPDCQTANAQRPSKWEGDQSTAR